jgi:hypothetical protein
LDGSRRCPYNQNSDYGSFRPEINRTLLRKEW